jgi:hypothetical protein
MAYLRSLFGELCLDDDGTEAHCMLFYSLWIGSGITGLFA